MQTLSWLPLCLLALGCSISPVISADPPDTRYDDCRQAAADYCEQAVRPPADEMQQCVATHAFQCVSAERATGERPQT